MKKQLLFTSLLLNLCPLFIFSFKSTTRRQELCPCEGFKEIYANGGYHIFKDEEYKAVDIDKDFESQRNLTRSRVIPFDTATDMIRHLPKVRNIYVTNYIDFDYEHILKILESQKGIDPTKRGIRVYYGAYRSETLNGKHEKNMRHYSAIVIGTNDGVDMYDKTDKNKFPIVNYGNLCPPICSGDDGSGIFFPNPAKATLYFDSGLRDTSAQVLKKLRKRKIRQ